MSNEITDEKLLAYLDGEAESQIAAQIEESTEHLNRAKELARLQNRLMTRLYRRICPESTELGEYHLNLLSKKHAWAIKQHVAECPHCSRELAQLREFLGEERPTLEPALAEQMKELVAQLVSGPRKGGLSGVIGQSPVFGLRGDKQDAQIYEADGVQVIIDIQKDAERPSLKNMLGLITGIRAQAYQINLYFEGEPVANTQVDDAGNFVVSAISSGEYQLTISGPGVEIQILSLRI